MVFIDLEKACDSILRSIIWDNLKVRGISQRYIEVIRDMQEALFVVGSTIFENLSRAKGHYGHILLYGYTNSCERPSLIGLAQKKI